MYLEDNFEQRMRFGRLFDIYGGLLTEKQQQCLGLYFYDDLSLSEVGDELGVSRQAVHDLLKRVEQTLEKYESKLNLLAKSEADQERIRFVINLLDGKTEREQEARKVLQALSGEGGK